MNGAVGRITKVEKDGSLEIAFEHARVRVDARTGNLRHLQHAYATTFHRAQGSEYPCAVVIIHKAHTFMHHRNLFYTGVTRAKEVVIVVGDRWGIRNCASKNEVDRRRTFLSLVGVGWPFEKP